MRPLSPTPYSDVNQILDLLYTAVREVLHEQLIGMYLHGSLANGGFDAHSDIDIVFITEAGLSEKTFAALQTMHTEMAAIDSPWAVQLEVAYIPESDIRRADPSGVRFPHLDRGSGERLHWTAGESDWNIERHILRERGIVIMGPDPKTLISPVSPDQLRRAVMEGVPVWFIPIIEDPSEINARGYQSFFVLTICRMLYTLKHGEILPKTAAADWAMDALDPEWRPLIERALLGRQNSSLAADPEDLRGTLEMMRYMLAQVQPTPYPEVNEVLYVLLTRVRKTLREQFVGMYLYGSLSSGGFDLETSDIDFVVFTTNPLEEQKVAELNDVHTHIWQTGLKWAGKLEGAYVPRELIRRNVPDGAPCPTVNEGRFYLAPLGSDWIIQRHVIRESGIVLAGPDPRTLIDYVAPDDIRLAVRGILQEWWFPMLDDHSWLAKHGSAYHAFAILTMCRALYTLEHGTVVSKRFAARWAQEELGERWAGVIEASISAQKPGAEQRNLLDDALELIRYTQDTLKL
jgi:predicted nucleotidyltransferase